MRSGRRGVGRGPRRGRVTFTDGQKLSNLVGPGKEFNTPEDYIRNSILDPQHLVVQNYAGAMPSFQGQLKERQITAIILMLKYLDRLVDPDGEPILSPDLKELEAGDGSEESGDDAEQGAGTDQAQDNGE